jgi:hypothetical protein
MRAPGPVMSGERAARRSGPPFVRLNGRRARRAGCLVSLLSVLLGAGAAQEPSQPTARLVRAPRLFVPGVDSNVPMTWDLIDGEWRLFATASWGGTPALMEGPSIDRLARVVDAVDIVPHPGHGVWIESIVPDEAGVWYGYYHHEAPADRCGRSDRQIPRLGAARSVDRGRTWEDLGVVLEAPAATDACASTNRFVLGGVGDVSAVLDAEHQDLYLFVSQYVAGPSAQGIVVARLAWADRDEPRGNIEVWQQGAWIPAVQTPGDGESEASWEYPLGTPLVAASRPWHDGRAEADAFWGPSIHWNTYLERYVMLMNRTKNESFDNEGIYVSYASSLEDPAAWSPPKKLMDGGGWYPQVVGLDHAVGTDKIAGRRARFFLTGKSEQWIEFGGAEGSWD